MSNIIVISDSSSDESQTEIEVPKPAPRPKRQSRYGPKSSYFKQLEKENAELKKLIAEYQMKIKDLEQKKNNEATYTQKLREAELKKKADEAIEKQDKFQAWFVRTLKENVDVRTVLEDHLQKENEYRARLNEEPLDIPSIIESTYTLKKPFE